MCSRKRDLHGAGCAEDGAWVCDILLRRRNRREWAREAMVAVFGVLVSKIGWPGDATDVGYVMKEKS